MPNEDPKKPDVERPACPHQLRHRPDLQYNAARRTGAGRLRGRSSDIYTLAYTNSQSEYIDKVVEVGAYRAHLTLNATSRTTSSAQSLQLPLRGHQASASWTSSSEWYCRRGQRGRFQGWIGATPTVPLRPERQHHPRRRVRDASPAWQASTWPSTARTGAQRRASGAPFADVDGHMYYAQAIAWAADAGIVRATAARPSARATVSRRVRRRHDALRAEGRRRHGSRDGALDGYADRPGPAWFRAGGLGRRAASWAWAPGARRTATSPRAGRGDGRPPLGRSAPSRGGSRGALDAPSASLWLKASCHKRFDDEKAPARCRAFSSKSGGRYVRPPKASRHPSTTAAASLTSLRVPATADRGFVDDDHLRAPDGRGTLSPPPPSRVPPRRAPVAGRVAGHLASAAPRPPSTSTTTAGLGLATPACPRTRTAPPRRRRC
ncbi:MAG: hypothetical protein ACLT98_10780 [Eggerthellaceae bacterium]